MKKYTTRRIVIFPDPKDLVAVVARQLTQLSVILPDHQTGLATTATCALDFGYLFDCDNRASEIRIARL